MIQPPRQARLVLAACLFGLTVLAACAPRLSGSSSQVPTASEIPVTPSLTPFQPATDTPGVTPSVTRAPTSTIPPSPTPQPASLWLSPAVPDMLRQFAQTSGLPQVGTPEASSARLDVLDPQPLDTSHAAVWIYVLVAPFPTVPDGVSLVDLLNTWHGRPTGPFAGRPLWMAPSTLAAFTALWGTPGPGSVSEDDPSKLADSAWANRPAWGILPFEALEPRWKVLSVDGQSPIHNDFDPTYYPLKIAFGLQPEVFPLVSTNRDPSKLTVLAMTGTTALVRGTADRMARYGLLYPDKFVGDVLRSADLTHISNEISFDPNCPTPDPWTNSLRFCSDPSYISLLEDTGVDIIELTGNHLLDYSALDLSVTIDMYDQEGWLHYGGGRDLEEALKPALVTNHGNKLAFVGCNVAGPPADWATASSPGSAPCDYGQLQAEIASLRSQGYLPIMTFQYYEYYQSYPTDYEQRDFRTMADAGAVIVSGSQAHMPATLELYHGVFVHYGLGNLFFDQMSHLMPDGTLIYDTRNEFIDRHIFYDGRYLGTELLTYILEDYAQPRPMTPAERTKFLQDIFKAGGW